MDDVVHVLIRHRIEERDRQHLVVEALSVGAEASYVPQLFIIGEVVDRDVVDVADDVLRAERIKELAPANGEVLRIDPEHIQVPDRVRPLGLLLHDAAGEL